MISSLSNHSKVYMSAVLNQCPICLSPSDLEKDAFPFSASASLSAKQGYKIYDSHRELRRPLICDTEVMTLIYCYQRMKNYFVFYYLVCKCLVTITEKSSIVRSTVEKHRKKKILTLKNTDMKNYEKNKVTQQLHQKKVLTLQTIYKHMCFSSFLCVRIGNCGTNRSRVELTLFLISELSFSKKTDHGILRNID